jgi:hypothetical protein
MAGASAISANATAIDKATDWFEGPACPVIPDPATAPTLNVQSTGLVDTSWANVGTDVWYYAWICDETKNNCSTEGTTSPWVPAWPYTGVLSGSSYLWTTGTAAEIDPIDAVLAWTNQNNTNGDTFAFYVSPFGAGNGSCSANANGCGGSPVATATVTAG